MPVKFITLLQRAAQLRQRHAFERANPKPDPMRLLKLRRLGLLVERQLLALHGHHPAFAAVTVPRRRLAINQLAIKQS